MMYDKIIDRMTNIAILATFAGIASLIFCVAYGMIKGEIQVDKQNHVELLQGIQEELHEIRTLIHEGLGDD